MLNEYCCMHSEGGVSPQGEISLQSAVSVSINNDDKTFGWDEKGINCISVPNRQHTSITKVILKVYRRYNVVRKQRHFHKYVIMTKQL